MQRGVESDREHAQRRSPVRAVVAEEQDRRGGGDTYRHPGSAVERAPALCDCLIEAVVFVAGYSTARILLGSR